MCVHQLSPLPTQVVARRYAATKYRTSSSSTETCSAFPGVPDAAMARLQRQPISVIRDLLLEIADADSAALDRLCAMAPSGKAPDHCGPSLDAATIHAWLAANGLVRDGESAAAAPSVATPSEVEAARVRVSVGAFVARQLSSGMHAARIVQLLIEGPEAAEGLETVSPWAEAEQARASAEATAEEQVVGNSGLTRGAERRLTTFVRSFRTAFQRDLGPRALQKNWSIDYPAILDRTEHRNL